MRVFDSSAVLALVFEEPGADRVAALLADGPACISAVNLAEVISKLFDRGLPAADVLAIQSDLPFSVEVFDADQAQLAGQLRNSTRTLGLSVGDRSCLALAQALQAEVVTADRPWKSLKGFKITLIR
jgi:ribonuclease VapC